MKLIYLYVQKFKLFSEKEFNLDSGYSVHYDSETHELEITKRSGLKSDFWSVNTTLTESPVVESVSAIIGENGSGKSTFAQILLELFRETGVHDFQCIAISEVDGVLFVYRTSGLTVSVKHNQSASDIHDTTYFPINLPVARYCYYSPIYTTERDRGRELWNDGDTCYDLSTTGILQSYTRDINIRDRDAFTAFDIDEKRRVLEFLSSVEDAKQQHPNGKFDFPIRYPVAVWLETEELAVKRVREKLKQQQEVFHGSGEKYSKAVAHVEQGSLTVLDRLVTLSEKASSPDFLIKAFLSYGILHLYDLNLTQFAALGEADDVEFLDFLETIPKSKDSTAIIRRQIFEYLEEHPPKRSRTGRIVGDRDGKTVLRTFHCLKELLEMSGVEEHKGMLILPLDNQKIRRKLLDLVKLHGESSIISKFLRFSFPHSISSGEMAFLSLFSRLFEQFSKFSSNPKCLKTEALVFFDEAETTLHPNFQRKLVFNAIWFFETFFPHAKVHLIFASHSPILLSDIPKDNCEFLVRKTEDGKRPVETSELKRIQNTFGANIFDLYRIPFFMNKGTMGELAEKKINRIIDLLNQAFSSAQNDQEGCQTQLSQTVLQEINDIKPLIGDGFLLRYIENTLRFIEPCGNNETWRSE